MNDTNQEKQALERRIINTARACVMLPGYGFLLALNTDWYLPPKREHESTVERLGPGIGGASNLTHLRQFEKLDHWRSTTYVAPKVSWHYISRVDTITGSRAK